MSYASGFMMGAALGKSIRSFFSGTEMPAPPAEAPRPAPPFALVSRQAGRSRYRVGHLGEELARLLEEKLGQLDFLTSVQANPATGSLLLTYAPSAEGKVDALAAELKERIFRAKGPGAMRCEPPCRPRHRHIPKGHITHSIHGTTRTFSEWIRRQSGGWLDLTSAVALLFFVFGVSKILNAPHTPSGVQLLWWAVALLRGGQPL